MPPTVVAKIPVICQYCDKQCSNKYTLATHQTSAKYCLAKQHEANVPDIIEELYECPHCSLKVSFRGKDRHINTCKRGLQAAVSNKETAIAEIQVQAEMYKQLYEKTQVPRYNISTQTDAYLEDSTIRIEELEETLSKYKKYYTKYKKLYTKTLEKKCTEIDTQTDNYTEMSDTIASLTEQVANLQAKLETFKNTPSTNRENVVTVVDPESRIIIPENTLENRVIMIGELPMIVRSSDGYINATELSKAAVLLTGRKRRDYNHWKDQADGFLAALSRTTGIPVQRLIYSTNGFVNGKRLPTMVHPLAAVNMTGWFDDNIGVQYMAWVFELQLRGTVTLGQEHTIDQNVSLLQAQVAQLTITNTEITGKLQDIMVDHSNLIKSHKLLNKNHQALQKKRRYHTFKQGNCMYVCHKPGDAEIKVGIATDINTRLIPYRTRIPTDKIQFLVYFEIIAAVETIFKVKHVADLVQQNHEVYRMKPEQAITSITEILANNHVPHTIEQDLCSYNDAE